METEKKEQQHKVIQHPPEKESKKIYILVEEIEKIAKDEYVFHPQIFKMGNDGTIQTEPETEEEKFDRMFLPIFNADEIELSENKSELDILKQENDIEYSNILRDEKKWLVEQKKAPNSDDIKNILKYIDNVKGRFIIWYMDNELKGTLINDTTKRGKYTKVSSSKIADIEIAAALRAFPKPPTLAQLEKESMRKLEKGKIGKTTFWNQHKEIIYWRIVIAEIDGRLESYRKLNQDTVDKLVRIKNILEKDLSNLVDRKDYEDIKSSGDIYEKGRVGAYKAEPMGYINIGEDDINDYGDNSDDREGIELDDYGSRADKNLG